MARVTIPKNAVPFGTEGSGHQIKFWVHNTLVKLNSKYHEAEKEVSAYVLGTAFGLPMTPYAVNDYLWEGKWHVGCECPSFIGIGEMSVTVYSMLEGLNVTAKTSAVEYFNIATVRIARASGISLQAVQNYFMHLLVFDYLICNSDRHFTNIELLYSEVTRTFRFAPIYDNGCAFLGRNSAPQDGSEGVTRLIRRYKSLPFSTNPEKNIIDRNIACEIARAYLQRVGGFAGLAQLPINQFHKYVVRIRFQKLLEVK